jgi:hypothetical protein
LCPGAPGGEQQFQEISGKTGLLPVFPGAWFKTNRVLEQAPLSTSQENGKQESPLVTLIAN